MKKVKVPALEKNYNIKLNDLTNNVNYFFYEQLLTRSDSKKACE